MKTLGDSVETPVVADVEAEADAPQHGVSDPDTRKELDIKPEPGDAQDVPNALRDEQANAKARKEAKAMDSAPVNEMTEKPEKEKKK